MSVTWNIQPPSPIGTLPLTQRVTERNLGVPREYASFAVPLGATTKMDGCAAIYPAIAAIFVAQFYGIELNIVSYLLIALVSVVGSAATAGTTGSMGVPAWSAGPEWVTPSRARSRSFWRSR